MAAVSHGAGLDPAFPPDVLFYTLAPDSDAEQSRAAKMASMLKGDLLYMETSERKSLCVVVTVGVRGPPGVEVQLVAVTSGPPSPHHDSARHPDGTDCQPVSFRGRGG